VVLRSTVMPGFTRGVLQPLLENTSGLRAGIDFGLGMYPEFLREANALADFRRPHCSIFGSLDERTAARLAQLCGEFGGEVVQTTLEEAEMAKLASNAFHALKVGFANEIGKRSCANAFAHK
jgi:GDP-mannose 6-dehydrogenase